MYLSDSAAVKVYTTMIVPLLTYCSILQLKLTPSQCYQLTSIHQRAIRIIHSPSTVHITSIINVIHKNACKTVRKCIDKNICENFHKYFIINNHSKCTRNQSALLKLPKVKLEFAKRSFYYAGAKLYYDLPRDIRKEDSYTNYCKYLDKHFSD